MFLQIIGCLFTVWLQLVGAECPSIISKKEWDGAQPKHIMYLPSPIELVIIQHTVTQTCSNDQSCAQIVRDIQKTHMEQSYLWDIGPSFLISNTGKIYEGRGWFHTAVHTFGYNNQSIGIAFIGNFQNQEPTKEALDAARGLIQCGVDKGYLTKDQVVLHKQLLPTASPGKNLAGKVMTWPNWKQDVTEIKKMVDTQDVPYIVDAPENEDEIAGRNALDLTTVVKSRSKREVLTTTKDIDLLSEDRGFIAELIDNIRDLAQQTLKTIKALRSGIKREINKLLENLTSGLRSCCLNPINAAVSGLSLSPFLRHCSPPIKEQANSLYNNTETKVKSCADKRVDEIEKAIDNLETLSANIINFSNTSVEHTRNCTELNLGIESITKACLNSVARQVQNSAKTYNSQRTLALDLIRSSVEVLPAALELCTKQPLLDGSTEAMNIALQATNCKPKFSFG